MKKGFKRTLAILLAIVFMMPSVLIGHAQDLSYEQELRGLEDRFNRLGLGAEVSVVNLDADAHRGEQIYTIDFESIEAFEEFLVEFYSAFNEAIRNPSEPVPDELGLSAFNQISTGNARLTWWAPAPPIGTTWFNIRPLP